MEFANGKHLTNYILKILRNTNAELSSKEERIIKGMPYLYDFIEFYVDVVECPVQFDSNFNTWIEYAKNGNAKKLCEIVEMSTIKIEKFKNRETSFDELFYCLDLDMHYRFGYLSSKPSNDDIYYPYKLPIGLSERYISRIIEILDVMNIVKCQEGKRTRYNKTDDTYGFITYPKVFADYRKFIKDEHNNSKIDTNYDYKAEIQKQIEILECNSS